MQARPKPTRGSQSWENNMLEQAFDCQRTKEYPLTSPSRSSFYALPRTVVGAWGFWLIILAFLGQVIISASVGLLRQPDQGNQFEIFMIGEGFIFIATMLAGIVCGWWGILAKKDYSIFLIAITSLMTLISLVFALGTFIIG